MTAARRSGVTLIELLVSLAIVGGLVGLASVSLRRGAQTAAPDTGTSLRSLRADRMRAMRDGIKRTGQVSWHGESYDYTVLPSGAVITAAPNLSDSVRVARLAAP